MSRAIAWAALAAAACGSDPATPPTDTGVGDVATDAPTDTSKDAGGDGAEAPPPLPATLTDDFQSFLAAEGLGGEDFVRAGKGGSFGGRTAAKEPFDRPPVVFVHGNSDAAIGRDATFTGWDAARRHLLGAGYSSATLYGITWGPADAARAGDQIHERAYLVRLRTFFSAVKKYTGRAKIAVVAHSMGVTLGRKAIEGGKGEDPAGAYDLGPRLTDDVDTFVGIAGGNLGLVACYSSDAATCDKRWGFWPGADAKEGPSKLLGTLSTTPHDEGAFVFSLCSKDDELLGFGGIVWGRSTCAIAGADADVAADGLSHVGLKDQTGPTLERLLVTHAP